MANFCTKCGKPLVNGQPCDCQKKVQKEMEAVKQQAESYEQKNDSSREQKQEAYVSKQQKYTQGQEYGSEQQQKYTQGQGPGQQQKHTQGQGYGSGQQQKYTQGQGYGSGQQQQYTQGQGYEQPQQPQKDYVQYGKNILKEALVLIKQPVEGFLQSVADEQNKIGLILMGIESVLSGLALYLLVNRIYSVAYSASSSIFGHSLTSAVSDQLRIPSAGMFFFQGFFITALISLIFTVIIFAIMRCMGKADMNWLQSCQIIGMKSLGVSIGLLVAVLSLIMGLFFFAAIGYVLGVALGQIYFMSSIMHYPAKSKTGVVYGMLVMVGIIALIVMMLFGQALLSAISSAGGSIF